jgi:TetR/AcrR family transcriptional regulator, cholesterol catabolism regulator
VSRIGERREHAQAEPSAEYAHKRAAIIEAAARVFQRSGYERASMNDVATEAGADRASVYYYFKGKHELFHAVIIEAVQHLVDSAEHIAAADVSAAEKVRDLVAELMRAYTDHYPYLYVYVQEDMTKLSVDDVSAKTLRRLARRFTSAVEGMIAAGIESGEFKSGLDPELAANAVLGALNWSHRWFKPGRATAPDDVAVVFVEIFLHGLVSVEAPVKPARSRSLAPDSRDAGSSPA